MGDTAQESLVSTSIPLNLYRDELESRYKLRCWDIGPMLQGMIMGCISTAYAEKLHGVPFNPYSQHCILDGNTVVWVVNTLTNEAYDGIVEPLLQATDLRIKKLNHPLLLGEPKQEKTSRRELTNLIHNSSDAKFTLKFASPTSFKSGGVYQIIPSLCLIYQNLIMHYSQVFDADHEVDPETVDYLVDHTRLVKYNLFSRSFLLADKRIPAFLGSITVEVKGPQALVGFANMLFHFGHYGGVGIKTSMGMGGLSVE